MLLWWWWWCWHHPDCGTGKRWCDVDVDNKDDNNHDDDDVYDDNYVDYDVDLILTVELGRGNVMLMVITIIMIMMLMTMIMMMIMMLTSSWLWNWEEVTSGATGTTGTPPTADKEDFTSIDLNIMLSMFLRMIVWNSTHNWQGGFHILIMDSVVVVVCDHVCYVFFCSNDVNWQLTKRISHLDHG